MKRNLCFASALEIAASIRAGELGARECLAYFQGRVARFNPGLNAVVVQDWERAGKRALAADEAQARGVSWGPLHGVPMTVKESFDLASHATTWGDREWKDNVPLQDDLVVQRMEQAGAIVFGKTNVPARLMDIQTFNGIHGVSNNPWDLSRTPGGSSGGCAAALAAGLTGLEVGSDIGGSIRGPSSLCGVFGHKPTFRLVGATRAASPGVLGVTDMAVAGPLARSAEDLAVSLQHLAGPGPLDGPWVPSNLPKPMKILKEYRIAFWPAQPGVEVDREIQDRCQDVADRLAREGVTISDQARPEFAPLEAMQLYQRLLEAAVSPFDETSHAEWRALDNQRAMVRLKWLEFFGKLDAVITPVMATTAFRHDHSPVMERTLQINGKTVPYAQQLFWGGLASLSYLPATAFPVGLGRSGLPVGLQIICGPHMDLCAIGMAGMISAQWGGFQPPPGYDDT